ncbi:MAG: hypothetical protein ACI8RD_012254 [Bacillariaceae sp.]|jgi:hypothetical protein
MTMMENNDIYCIPIIGTATVINKTHRKIDVYLYLPIKGKRENRWGLKKWVE